MGAFTFVLWAGRFLLFHLHESPKWLIGQGRYAEAIEVLDAVAAHNNTTQPLTVEDLLQVEREHLSHHSTARLNSKKAALDRALRQFRPGGFTHVRALFSTRILAFSTSLLVLIWGMIGLASPLYSNFLPEYLAAHGAQTGSSSIAITYRNNLIIIACSIPGCLVGGVLINVRRIGRKGTMGFSLILTAVFLFAFTAARNSAQILAFNCVATFVQYMYVF